MGFRLLFRRCLNKTKKVLIGARQLSVKESGDYISEVSKKSHWVYISYISDVFCHKEDESYLNVHQNRKEALAIVSVFNKLGYNVYVQSFCSNNKLPRLKKVDLVFGLEPNFERACQKYSGAKRVYYATGAYFEHQNRQVIYITDYVNAKHGSHLSYKRLVQPHRSNEIADSILMIGSEFTKLTCPVELRHKITILHQSVQSRRVIGTIKYSSENEYFYMGSYGNLLKGMPLLFEYFISHPRQVLNVVGPVEEDYWQQVIEKSITSNIRFYGFLDVESDELFEIIDRCNFMIYPSLSEGCPGSVLCSMKNGLIPIVTKWAAFDGVEDYGFLIKDYSIEELGKGIEWSQTLSREKVVAMKKRCAEFVKKTYSLERFTQEFTNYFTKILSR